jgi:UDP-N-acetyl-D-galactosamine dehydrogenase
VQIHDPLATPSEARHEYGIELVEWDMLPKASAIIAAVAHDEFRERPLQDYLDRLEPAGVLVDVKWIFDSRAARQAGVSVWRL